MAKKIVLTAAQAKVERAVKRAQLQMFKARERLAQAGWAMQVEIEKGVAPEWVYGVMEARRAAADRTYLAVGDVERALPSYRLAFEAEELEEARLKCEAAAKGIREWWTLRDGAVGQ